MSYNGSGTFQINTSGQPVVTGTSISSTVFNALTADLATGLSTAITKDGQTTTTARIPFALGINSTLVTDATNTTSGSIITAGGVGIAKALYVGTTANVAGAVTLGGVATFSAQPIFSSLTASSAVATDASKGLVSVTNTGTGNNVLATSPTLTTPVLGTPSSGTLTNCTGLPASTGITGTLGTTNGGTGLTSFTANGVVYASSSSALTTGSALNFDGTNLGVGSASLSSSSGRTDFTLNGSSSGGIISFGNGGVRKGYLYQDGTDFSIANEVSGALRFINNGSERARIDSSGNLGLGVTPSAWGSPLKPAIELPNGVYVTSYNGGALSAYFGANNYYNGSSYIYKNNGYATQYAHGSGGAHVWNIAPSGTAGNTISFTQAMTLDANGKLTIARTDGTGIQAIGVYNTTTASSGNVVVISDGVFQRSTSSARFKTDVETIDVQYAQNILNARPVWYRSLCANDNKDWGHWGFIAEELAEIDPRLVYWKTEETTFVTEEIDGQSITKQVSTKLDTPIADGVQYDRFVPLLLKQLQEQQALITTLTDRITALEARNG